jgi:aldose 1-epimerase
VLRLETDAAAVTIHPQLGAAVTRFDVVQPSGRHEAVFRPAPATLDPARFDPNDLSCYPLVPWVSRLRPPVLPADGGTLPIPPTRPGESFPLHGWGWYAAWTVRSADPTSVQLSLEHPGPPAFAATLSYALEGATLSVAVEVENREPRRVGMGLGFHPWFPRHPTGRLRAPARTVWLSGPDRLPTAAAEPPEPWRFAVERALPHGDLDHAFDGWDGTASYRWQTSEGERRLTIQSDCYRYIIYAPPGRDFFCFEPISHRPAPAGEADGLVMLGPGERMARWARFAVAPLG